MAKTKIEWAEYSWNPIRARDLGPVGTGPSAGHHCEIITPGCERCYAEARNKRLGTHRPYLKTSRNHVHVYLDEKTLAEPLRWRKPRRIFVCSMSDLFGEWDPDEMIDRVHAVMALCPQHTFLVLTKRAARMRDYLRGSPEERIDKAMDDIAPAHWCARELEESLPLPNVWVGVSVEDQRRADERIPVLLDTPAAVRWVSAEPLLEAVLFDKQWLPRIGHRLNPPPLQWVVVGGESGPGARPFDVEWARAIIAQCGAAGTACFVKQLGARPIIGGGLARSLDRKGGDPGEWPQDLRVREYPAQEQR